MEKIIFGMSPDSSINYDLSTIKSGEKKYLDIFIYIKDNLQKKLYGING